MHYSTSKRNSGHLRKRHVALSADVMKMCERIAFPKLRKVVQDSIDPSQFAYRNDRSCEDAILSALDSGTRKLDRRASTDWNEQTGGKRPSTANSVRIMFNSAVKYHTATSAGKQSCCNGRAGHDDLLDTGLFDFPFTVRAAW